VARSVRPVSKGGKGQDANTVYALGASEGESARLQRQADELAAVSAALLDHVGLRPGQSAVDLGCGPQGILHLLAERVAPGGRVVGLDADPVLAAMAAEFAARRGLAGVEVRTGDARDTGLPSDSCDLVHCRTLLINVPEPAPELALDVVVEVGGVDDDVFVRSTAQDDRRCHDQRARRSPRPGQARLCLSYPHC
jgi:SAM-dependent methyltransferase